MTSSGHLSVCITPDNEALSVTVRSSIQLDSCLTGVLGLDRIMNLYQIGTRLIQRCNGRPNITKPDEDSWPLSDVTHILVLYVLSGEDDMEDTDWVSVYTTRSLDRPVCLSSLSILIVNSRVCVSSCAYLSFIDFLWTLTKSTYEHLYGIDTWPNGVFYSTHVFPNFQ